MIEIEAVQNKTGTHHNLVQFSQVATLFKLSPVGVAKLCLAGAEQGENRVQGGPDSGSE